jgi:hypothetical protein
MQLERVRGSLQKAERIIWNKHEKSLNEAHSTSLINENSYSRLRSKGCGPWQRYDSIKSWCPATKSERIWGVRLWWMGSLMWRSASEMMITIKKSRSKLREEGLAKAFLIVTIGYCLLHVIATCVCYCSWWKSLQQYYAKYFILAKVPESFAKTSHEFFQSG